MKLLVAANGNVSGLSSLTESIAAYMTTHVPYVMLGPSCQYRDYSDFAANHPENVYVICEPDKTADAMARCLEHPRRDGSLDSMAMILTEDMLFTRMPPLDDVWAALNADSVLGVNLCIELHPGDSVQQRASRGRQQRHIWNYRTYPGGPDRTPTRAFSHPFGFGVVYKLTKLMSALRQHSWYCDTPEELRHSLDYNTTWGAQSYMACFDTPSMQFTQGA